MEKKTAHSWLGVVVGLAPMVLGLVILFALAFWVKHTLPGQEFSKAHQILGLAVFAIVLFGSFSYIIWREEKATYGGQPIESGEFTVVADYLTHSEYDSGYCGSIYHCVDAVSSDGYVARLVQADGRVYLDGSAPAVGDIVTLEHQKAKDPDKKRVRTLWDKKAI